MLHDTPPSSVMSARNCNFEPATDLLFRRRLATPRRGGSADLQQQPSNNNNNTGRQAQPTRRCSANACAKRDSKTVCRATHAQYLAGEATTQASDLQIGRALQSQLDCQTSSQCPAWQQPTRNTPRSSNTNHTRPRTILPDYANCSPPTDTSAANQTHRKQIANPAQITEMYLQRQTGCAKTHAIVHRPLTTR